MQFLKVMIIIFSNILGSLGRTLNNPFILVENYFPDNEEKLHRRKLNTDLEFCLGIPVTLQNI